MSPMTSTINEPMTPVPVPAKVPATEGLAEVARVVIVNQGLDFFVLSMSAGNAVYGVGKKIRAPGINEDAKYRLQPRGF